MYKLNKEMFVSDSWDGKAFDKKVEQFKQDVVVNTRLTDETLYI